MEPSRAARQAHQSARPAGGATRALRAPRSLLSPAPRPRSLPWRAEEAPSLRRGLPRPLPALEGGGERPPEKHSREVWVSRREPWSPGRWHRPSSRLAGRQGRQLPWGPRCLPAWSRANPFHPSAPSSCPFANSGVRCAAENRRAGSWEVGMCAARQGCIVLYRPRRSIPTRFCRRAAGRGVIVVSCLSEPGSFCSP